MRTRPGSPGVVRQPVNQGRGSQGSRSRVDQTLPPFSNRRYFVIWLAILVPLVFIILALIWFNNNNSNNSGGTASSGTSGTPGTSSGSAAGGPGKYFVIDTAKGKIVAKLYTDASAGVPNTVANFVDKANKGEFNGRIFHRVEDWVIQGGDPLGNGTGGGQMKSEYNQIPFKAGALGVARGNDPAINNDSQFFITKSDADYLNGQYTNFGQVTEGMDVVQKIAIGDKINKITIENR
jgi:peptidyl-prolyl cis-trans isomerase B (cyclophilin B)